MKKLLLILFLFIGLNSITNAQTTLETDTLRNLPYVCQADSFTVTISGMHWMGGYTLDSTVHEFRNDSLLIHIYYNWQGGISSLSPFQLPLRFSTPQPGLYTIYSKRFTNGMPHGHGTSYIGICTAVSGIKHIQFLTDVKLYPNPTKSFLNIELPENTEAVSALLSDLTGKTLITRRFKANEQKQLHLENLKPGIYLLMLQTENGKTVRKIVKN